MGDTNFRLALAVVTCAVVVWALRTGPVYGQGGRTFRDERPGVFWGVITLLVALSMAAASTAVLDLLR